MDNDSQSDAADVHRCEVSNASLPTAAPQPFPGRFARDDGYQELFVTAMLSSACCWMPMVSLALGAVVVSFVVQTRIAGAR